ncbi:MAG: xanthine dehydrogenase family protein subunit M [Rhodospirillales bacterium]|nr:xanthine dehydrogenase family protein subunit M [Rhodospirillales bacterium]
MLPAFELLEPTSLEDALEALADGRATPMAGGTNLLPDLRARVDPARRFVDLSRIDELRGIDRANGRVVMGGGTTLTDILRDPALRQAAPSLVAAAEVFAGLMVRNAATVGGNICYGSPSADVVPPLLSLDAEVTLDSHQGARSVPLDGFFLDYKKTVMRADEILTAVSWTPPGPGTANLFYKLGRRKGDAITVTGVAVALAVEGGRCAKARIALGSVAPTVFRVKDAEGMLEGEPLTDELIEAAARTAADACRPIDDLRASAEYRSHTAHVLTRRLLRQAWELAA